VEFPLRERARQIVAAAVVRLDGRAAHFDGFHNFDLVILVVRVYAFSF
jgi:hypothetical protein